MGGPLPAMVRAAALAAAVVATTALAVWTAADETVVTRDGRRLSGKVTRSGAEILVAMKLGSVRLDPGDVVRVEPDPASAIELVRRLSALAAADDAARLELARWAGERRLHDRAREIAAPLLAGAKREEAARLTARTYIDELVEADESKAGPDVIKAIERLDEAAARELVARHAAASAALARDIAAAGPMPVAECGRRYQARRGALWAMVGDESFQRASPERSKLAIGLWRRLEVLYLADTTAPFVRARHAVAFAEVVVLESLALDLQVPLPAEIAYEGALTAVARPLDRAALARELGRPWQGERALTANAAFGAVSELERALVGRVNAYRDALLLETLVLEPRLCRAAAGHTDAMLDRGFFAHASPLEGLRQPADRVAATGYPWALVGEVLARYSSDPVAVFDAFLASPSHHYALVVPRFREIGANQRQEVWTAVLGVRR